jgi:signal transduction histidine kinase
VHATKEHLVSGARDQKDDVLCAVAHDLRGPLTFVLAFVDHFLQKAKPDECLICDRKQVEAIQRSARQMNRLIEDLLDSASISERSLYLERKTCPVIPLVNEAMELPRVAARSKSIQLKSDLPADLRCVLVDPHRILQVFANLIGNAIKFTPAGGTVTVRAENAQGAVHCCVEDTGTGISRAEMAHVFDRFWQARRAGRAGTGLGLFIVKGIVEAHGGNIWVESKPGAGSRFHFTLPVPM